VADRKARISVLAGANGAGKSSIAGATLRARGAEYYNPDEAAREYRAVRPESTVEQANAAAWEIGREMLVRAIRGRLDFVFETTLGGKSITSLLEGAITAGLAVSIWYTGLATVQLHMERVRARVREGGHDIPSAAIRRRYEQSPRNLIRLMPGLTSLYVYDNSTPADPATGVAPIPFLVLHMEDGRIKGPEDLARTPDWAKSIVARALELHQEPH